MRKFRWFSLLTVLALLLGAITPLAAAPAAPDVTQVNVAGSFESEIGGNDWSNNDPLTNLSDANGDGVWKFSATVPAGNYEYKIVEDGDWGKAYPANNVPVVLAANGEVRWYYDQADHYVADSINQVIATVPGSYQKALGCSGDWDPGCLRSWLQDPDGDGTYSFTTTAIPVGSYEAKVALDEKWDVNYGQGGVLNGPNIAFTVSTAADPVTFTYNATTHVLTIQTTPPPPRQGHSTPSSTTTARRATMTAGACTCGATPLIRPKAPPGANRRCSPARMTTASMSPSN